MDRYYTLTQHHANGLSIQARQRPYRTLSDAKEAGYDTVRGAVKQTILQWTHGVQYPTRKWERSLVGAKWMPWVETAIPADPRLTT